MVCVFIWDVLHIIWFVWLSGLCEWMVCVIIWFMWMVWVKGCNIENDKWFVDFLVSVIIWFVWINGLCVWLSGLCEYMICVIIWFVWIPSHKPSLHTNNPFTQTMYHSLFYLLCGLCDYLVFVNKWFVWRHGLCEGITSLHTNHLYSSVLHPFTQAIPSHKPFIILCTTYYLGCTTYHLVCVIIWFVWINGLCDYLVCETIYHILTHKPDNNASLHTNHPFTQTIDHSLYYLPSHKPSQIITQTLIILCITSLHTNHPFTQTIYTHKPDNHTNKINPFMQTIYCSLYYSHTIQISTQIR